MRETNRTEFIQGLRDGLPIGLGYFAVAFTLGIAARRAGLTAFQAGLASFLTNASAGEAAGFTVIAEGGSYLTMKAAEKGSVIVALVPVGTGIGMALPVL